MLIFSLKAHIICINSCVRSCVNIQVNKQVRWLHGEVTSDARLSHTVGSSIGVIIDTGGRMGHGYKETLSGYGTPVYHSLGDAGHLNT